jgi:hypothetical protein
MSTSPNVLTDPPSSEGTAPDPVRRSRVAVLAVVIAVASLAMLPCAYLYPEAASGDDVYRFADLADIRDRWWGVNVALAASMALAVPGVALAGMLLARRRGATWATVGGVLMCIGAALCAVGLGGVATAYWFATDTAALDPATATGLVDAVSDASLLYALAAPGIALVGVGTVVQAVGLWRSRNLPRWVPVLSATVLVTFFLSYGGWFGALIELPTTVAAIAIGYFAWRRA